MVNLFILQLLNGLQLGVLLFLIAAGLTLVFGIMDVINLAHGVLYMVGAYLIATFAAATGSFWWGLLLMLPAAVVVGLVIEFVVMRRLYARSHLDQVLATFGLVMIANEALLKRLLRQPRPESSCLKSNGMPSSHSALSLAWSWTMSRWPAPFRAVIVFLLLVPWSRVQIGDHSVSQVVVGGVLGAGAALAVERVKVLIEPAR